MIQKGSTDVTRYVVLRNSTTGAPETGYTITSLDFQYTRNRSTPATKVDAVALAATDTAHTDGRAIQVDATSSPGLYRVDWPDAAFATGVDKVVLVVSGTGIDPAYEEIKLVDMDLEGQSAIDLKDFADDGYDPSTNKVQGVVLTDTVTTYTGNTPQTGDSYAIVNSGTHGNAALKTLIDAVDNFIDTEVAAIKTVTDAIGATGSGLSAIPWNASWDAEVQSEVQDALDAAAAEPTGVPAASASLLTKVGVLYMALRNRVDVTATKKTFYDDGGAAEFEKDLTDDGTTYQESEVNSI